MTDSRDTTPWFHGDSQMAALLREHDWRTSPLGPPESWAAELRTLVNLMLAARYPVVVVWGPQSLFLYNDAYSPLLGERHPAAIGRPFSEVWPQLWTALEPVARDTMEGRATVVEDVPVVMAPSGQHEQRWFTWAYSPVRNAQGEVVGMFNTGYETTDRVMGEHKRQFEDALVACLRNMSNPDQISAVACALLGQRLNAGRVGYADIDAAARWVSPKTDWTDGRMTSVAGQVFRFDDFGPGLRHALQAGEIVRVHDVRQDPRTRDHADNYAAAGTGSFLCIPLFQNGTLRALLTVNFAGPHRWTDLDQALAQNLVEHTWVAVEAARSQSELRLEQEQSRYILDNMDEGFVLIDHDWTLLQVNDIGAEITGQPRDRLVGRTQWDALPQLIGSPIETVYRRVHATRQSEALEYLHTHADGRRAWLEVRVYPSMLGRLAIFFRDITKRKAAERELTDANRRKDEFLAMLAHELRNPLAPIGAAADLLSLGSLDAERIRRTSAVIARQVRHMTSLVDDLLDVSRVTRGLVALEKLELDAKRIVHDAIEQVRPMMDARRQHFTLELPPDPAYVCGDHKRLVQVLTNLLGNAAKYTPEGGAIALRMRILDHRVCMAVADNGIGMAPDLVQRAFELFAQAERTSDRSQGGLGLGLALVKSLVELHNGSVTAHSAGLGKGSEFTVTLPRIDSPAPPTVPDRRVAREPLEQGLHLLVVDDNADAASMLAMFLESAGHRVMIEHESRRALERARMERPQVCLLDIGLPDITGYELARRLRAQPETAHAVLVAVTGYGQDQDRRKAAEAGFDFHFVKPVDTQQLIRLLNGIAAQRTMRPE
ncbi:MAG: ATP-binding protein [Gammaproteobacteria bacterium]